MPQEPLRLDYQNFRLTQGFMYVLEQLGVDILHHTLDLTFEEWQDVYPFYVFALKRSTNEAWGPPEKGNVRLEMTFAKPLPTTTKLMLLFEHERIIHIYGDGRIEKV